MGHHVHPVSRVYMHVKEASTLSVGTGSTLYELKGWKPFLQPGSHRSPAASLV